MTKNQRNLIQFIYVDLFCGAGGTSTGVERARDVNGNQIAKVIACVNHDINAINSHFENHPDVKHFTEDIRLLNIDILSEYVHQMRILYPNAKLVLWASLECTNFSNAKGGKAKDPDSRTLADHLDRYVEGINPDFIQVENVREFQTWGDLDENNKPIPELKGRLFKKWMKRIDSYGYRSEKTMLNAADFGAYTSRDRLFICFAKEDLPISFPVQTHARKIKNDIFFSSLKKWKPVREVLDLDDEGISIFLRKEHGKKDLVDGTLNRIYSGLTKGAKTTLPPKTFLTEYYGKGYAQSIDKPIGTLTTKDRHAKIDLTFINPETRSTFEMNPVMDQSCGYYLLNPQWGGTGRSIEKPCFTLIARMDKAPPYLLRTEKGSLAIRIEDSDSDVMKKIKAFMAWNGIIDIKLRMLSIPELLRIQGFGDDYKLIGTKGEQKKYIGNAVHPDVAKAWIENLGTTLLNHQIKIAV